MAGMQNYTKGLDTSGMDQRRADDKQKWDQMMQMLSFAQSGDPQTLLGFGLGRLLRNLYQRGQAKDNEKLVQGAKAALQETKGATANGMTPTGEMTIAAGLLGDKGPQMSDTSRTELSAQSIDPEKWDLLTRYEYPAGAYGNRGSFINTGW